MLSLSLLVPVLTAHLLTGAVPAPFARAVSSPCTPHTGTHVPRAIERWYYTGPHANEVRYLLSRADGWSVDAGNLRTPTIDFEMSCSRDESIAAAITKAFGAEAYAAQGDEGKAEEWAGLMHQDLEQVNALCSPNVPTFAGGSECATLDYWPCPAPF